MIPRDAEKRSELTPDERRMAIARLLASAVLRLHARAALVVSPQTPTNPQNFEKSERACLDMSAKSVLSGHVS
jgi:hypothetical protein